MRRHCEDSLICSVRVCHGKGSVNLLHLARQQAKLLLETLAEIGDAAEADGIRRFGDGTGVLLQEIHRPVQAHVADKVAGRLVRQGRQLAVQL